MLAPLMQFQVKFQQPGKSIRTFKADAAFTFQIGGFTGNIGSRQALLQSFPGQHGEGRIRKGSGQSRQQPVSMHGGMPVIASVECRSQLSRSCGISVAVEKVADLVGILPMHTTERQAGKTLGQPYGKSFHSVKNQLNLKRSTCISQSIEKLAESIAWN